MQEMIMARGSLEGSRDKTAVLMSRIRQALEGNLVVKEPRNGDWYCPNCNDLQFRRNTTCRKCGTPNPGTGGVQVQARPSQSSSPSQYGNQFGTSGQPMPMMQQMQQMQQMMNNSG